MTELITLETGTTKKFTDDINTNFNNLNNDIDRLENKLSEDFVIEQGQKILGTKGVNQIIWTYRIWDSGITECWALTDVMKLYYGQVWYQNLVYADVSVAYPSELFAFEASPYGNPSGVFEGTTEIPNFSISISTLAGSDIFINSINGVKKAVKNEQSGQIFWYAACLSPEQKNREVRFALNVKGRCNKEYFSKLADKAEGTEQTQDS